MYWASSCSFKVEYICIYIILYINIYIIYFRCFAQPEVSFPCSLSLRANKDNVCLKNVSCSGLDDVLNAALMPFVSHMPASVVNCTTTDVWHSCYSSVACAAWTEKTPKDSVARCEPCILYDVANKEPPDWRSTNPMRHTAQEIRNTQYITQYFCL